MNAERGAGVSLPDALAALWRQRACWVLLWLLASAAVLAAVWLIPPRYRTEAILTLEAVRAPGRLPAGFSDADLRARLEVARLKVLQRDRLLDLVRRAYPELPAKWKPEEAPEQIQQLRSRITVSLISEFRSTRLSAVRVAFEGPDGAGSAALVNAVARALSQEFGEVAPPEAGDEQRRDPAAEAARRLAEAERAWDAFEQEHGDLAQQEESLTAERTRRLSELGELERALAAAEQERKRWEEAERNRAGRSTAARAPQAGEAEGHSSALRGEIEQRLAVLLARYKEDHPDVRRARAELARLEAAQARSGNGFTAAERARPDDPSSIHTVEQAPEQLARVRERVRELESQRRRVGQALAATEEGLRELAKLRRRQAALERQRARAEAAYRSAVWQREEEARQKPQRNAGPVLHLRVLEEAVAARAPVFPDRRLLGILGSLAALLPCAAAAIGREIGHTRVLAALGLAGWPSQGAHREPVVASRVNGRAAHAG